MNRCLVLIGLLIALPASVLAQEDVGLQAATAYESGDYDTAIRLYEELIAGGAQDGAIYYNLGNAYYQSGEIGRALLNYRRAQNFMPRDSDLNTNLALIRSRRLDVQGDETGLLESLSVLTASVLTLTELAWIAFGLWTLWFALLSVAILRERLRDVLRAPLLILGVVTLAGLVLLGSRLLTSPSAVIIETTVQVMSGPGEDYLELFQLHEAAELRLLETNGDWIRFALPDGRQGWIRHDAVETV